MDVYDSKIQRRLAPKDGSLDVLAERVDQLKALFKQEFEQNKDLYDKRDFDRIMDKDDDWYARRWIIYQRDVPTAFQMLKDTMRWRKEMNLNDLSYEDFPREFFECGCVFEYGRDKKGKLALNKPRALGFTMMIASNMTRRGETHLLYKIQSATSRPSSDVHPV